MSDPLSVVEIAEEVGVRDPDAIFAALLSLGQESPMQFTLAYQSVDSWIRVLSEQRKLQNRQLMELEKAWGRTKAAVKAKLLEILQEHGEQSHKAGEEDKRKLSTILGTSYLIARPEWNATLHQGSAAEAEAAKHLASLLVDKGDANDQPAALQRLVDEGYVLLQPRLTEAGREAAKKVAVDLAETTGVIVGWAEVHPPGHSIGFRAKKGAPVGRMVTELGRQLVDGSKDQLRRDTAGTVEALEEFEA